MPKTEATRGSTKELPRVKRKAKKWEDEDVEEENDEDSEFEALPRWKLCLIGAIVFLCFALLYPSVFGPILNSLLGRGQTQPTTTSSNMPPVHPALSRQAGASPGARPHMHPAASARMPHVEAQQQTGRGGMFTWMLPIYTIGVMVFLFYTLFKIMFKSKKKKKRRGRHVYSSADEDESEEEDDTGANHTRLRSLQSRLQETEAAMSKILEQLEGIAQTSNTDPSNTNESVEEDSPEEKRAEPSDKMTPEQLKNIEESMQKLTKLSQLYKKQRARLDASEDEQEEEESSEEEVDELVSTYHSESGEEVAEHKSSDDEFQEEAREEVRDSPPKAAKHVRRRPKRE